MLMGPKWHMAYPWAALDPLMHMQMRKLMLQLRRDNTVQAQLLDMRLRWGGNLKVSITSRVDYTKAKNWVCNDQTSLWLNLVGLTMLIHGGSCIGWAHMAAIRHRVVWAQSGISSGHKVFDLYMTACKLRCWVYMLDSISLTGSQVGFTLLSNLFPANIIGLHLQPHEHRQTDVPSSY